MAGRDNAAYLRELRARAVAAGKCACCRARPAAPGKKTCHTCLDKREERRLAHIAVGRCQCGEEPRAGRATCGDCADRSAARGRRINSDARAAGLCVGANGRSPCGAPARPGRTQCAECARTAARRARELNRRQRDARARGPG